MKPISHCPTSPAAEVAPGLHAALVLLLEAFGFARQLRRRSWDFAVAIDSLRRAGLTDSELRWLVCKGYAEHAAETNGVRGRRPFRRTGSLTLTDKTCVVLTEAGAAFGRQLIAAADGRPADSGGAAPRTAATADRVVPQWNAAERVLRIGGRIVKHFQQPSPNQETILAAFEEEGWPPHVDDPLPQQPGLDPKRRLHDTIHNLNRHQRQRLIHFHSDGTGQGVCWRLDGESYTRATPELHQSYCRQP